jgi:hypothetical protein
MPLALRLAANALLEPIRGWMKALPAAAQVAATANRQNRQNCGCFIAALTDFGTFIVWGHDDLPRTVLEKGMAPFGTRIA